MAARREYPSKEFLDKVFTYEPETGRLLHRLRAAGKEAGSIKASRRGLTHRIVGVGKRQLLVHVIVWIMNYGSISKDMNIDHVDGDGLNNRLENLRLVTHQHNMRNQAIHVNSKSGQMGVRRSRFKWVASISHNGAHISLGTFKRKSDAIAARKAAEKRFGYHPNHGKIRSGFEPETIPSWAEYFYA